MTDKKLVLLQPGGTSDVSARQPLPVALTAKELTPRQCTETPSPRPSERIEKKGVFNRASRSIRFQRE